MLKTLFVASAVALADVGGAYGWWCGQKCPESYLSGRAECKAYQFACGADVTNPNSAFREALREMDPTDPNSGTREALRSIDPTNPANVHQWIKQLNDLASLNSVCGGPFMTYVLSVYSACTVDHGFGSGYGDLDKARDLLVFHGFFSRQEFDRVQVKWCELLDGSARGMVPAPDVILLARKTRHISARALVPLLAHEMTHVRQVRRLGYSGFACAYSGEIIAGRGTNCDDGNKLECEARDASMRVRERFKWPDVYFFSGKSYFGYDRETDRVMGMTAGEVKAEAEKAAAVPPPPMEGKTRTPPPPMEAKDGKKSPPPPMDPKDGKKTPPPPMEAKEEKKSLPRPGALSTKPILPRPIKGHWPGVWEDGIDEAVNWGNGKIYLFKGDEYVRYDIGKDAKDPGYPMKIKDQWKDLWPGGIDAAVNWGNGKVYFFKGAEYVRFDVKTDRVEKDYPMKIKDQWKGLWPDGIDAAINWENGKVYFFKGDQYMRYDVATESVDPDYPKYIRDEWPGLFTEDIDAAVAW